MSANYDIIIRVTEENLKLFGVAADQVSKVGTAVKETDTKLKGVGSGADAFADKLDRASTRARVGLSSVAQLADVAGINLSGIVGPAASAADAVGDLAGSMEGLGKAQLAALGVIGVIGAGIALVVSKLQAQHDATVETIRVTDEYLASMSAVTAGNAQAAAAIDQIANSMAALQGMGSRNPLTQLFESFNSAKIQLEDFFQSLEQGIVRFRSMGEIIAAQKSALDDFTFGLRSGYDALENLRASATYGASAIGTLGAAMRDAAAAANQLAADTDAYYNRLVEIQGATNTAFYNTVQANHALVGQESALDANARKWDAYNDLLGKRYPISVSAAKSANDAWLASLNNTGGYDKAKAAAERLYATLKGLVENALQPTAADPNMGDSWDEARKRFEAFATGTDTGAYGEEFKAMFDSLGMSAEQAAQKFKDFSLFADPANLQLIDWGPVVANVEQQLLSMAGKANVTAEAMKEVWKNLSPQARQALAAQGIDNATEALDALVDPAGAAEKKVSALNKEIGATPTIVTTNFVTMTETAAADIETFQTEVLDPFIAKYGNVTISITAETSANAPSGTPPPSGDTSTSGVPGGVPGGGAYATGLDWYVPGGYPNDSYRFQGNLSSGEHVQITPAGHSAPPGAAPNIIVYVQTEDGNYRRSRRIRTMAQLGMT